MSFRGRGSCRLSAWRQIVDEDVLWCESFIFLAGPGKKKGPGDGGPALSKFRDEIAAAQPVRFSQIGRRPLCRVIRMRMIKAGDFKVAAARLAGDLHQFGGGDLIAVCGGTGLRIGCAQETIDAPTIRNGQAEQGAAALVRIGRLSMFAEIQIDGARQVKDAHISFPRQRAGARRDRADHTTIATMKNCSARADVRDWKYTAGRPLSLFLQNGMTS